MGYESAGGPPLRLMSLVDQRFQTVSVCIASPRGSRDERPELAGSAHMLEHLLMSSPVDGGPSVVEAVDLLGGRANAETGLDTVLFWAQVHPRDAAAVLPLLYAAVLRASFEPRLVDRERAVVLRELAMADADGSDLIQDLLLGAIFPGHPLGRRVGGSAESVSAMTCEQLKASYDEDFLARPLCLIVSGPQLPPIPFPVVSEWPRDPVPAQCWDLAGGRPRRPPRWVDGETWLGLGARTPGRHSEESAAYLVLSYLLGGSPASTLYQLLRTEHGLSYAFDAWFRGYDDAGVWRIVAGVEGSQAARAVALITGLIEDVAQASPQPAQVAAAKWRAETQLLLNTELSIDHVRVLAQRSHAGAVPWSRTDEIASLRNVTPADVQAAAAQVAGGLVVVATPERG